MEEQIDLADRYRQAYRARYFEDVQDGNATPFIFHLTILGLYVIPTLYLAIPHKKRPWLYRARWLVLALTTTFHIWMMRNIRSSNFAFAYGSGLMASWGIVSNFTLLVWTRPQWDAKRVERFKNPQFVPQAAQNIQHGQGVSNGHATKGSSNQASSSGVSPGGHVEGTSSTTSMDSLLGDTSPETNGHGDARFRGKLSRSSTQGSGSAHDVMKGFEDEDIRRGIQSIIATTLKEHEPGSSIVSAADLRALSTTQEFIYEWQEYPEDAPFSTRLDWAFDICNSMRFTGWNWAIPVLPPYRPPPWFRESKAYQLPLSYLQNTSRHGYTRPASRKEFLAGRMPVMAACYLLIDFCAVYIIDDPYFILGPNAEHPLPPNLAALHPALLSVRRSFFAFFAILSGLYLYWNLVVLTIMCLGGPLLGFRADPWHLASVNGSFSRVLDRGLAGLWGSWWHQSFRFGFAAPTTWLIRRGHLVKGSPAARVVGFLVAFAQSGFLHAAGSYTSLPRTRPWEPPLFFLLAGVGTELQGAVARLFRARLECLPRWVRRLGNLVFVIAWMHITCWFLIDDFGRSGLWLWEPVPFSFIRFFALGKPGDHCWRWDRPSVPRWWTGKHWWDSGLGV
ncbi:membrane bound O-acyl transferase family-domain-containing protein [Xylariales sp. PMI_506]|nr:membrane bound O-acyl transferase family-domain-containing protein [Xylariales sp. PMI_506]